jgi:hypothetical protein
MSDKVALSEVMLFIVTHARVARISPADSPRFGPKRAKFALNERTGLAPKDRTDAARGQQNRRRRQRPAEIERDVVRPALLRLSALARGWKQGS